MADVQIKIKALVEEAGGDNSIAGIRKSVKALRSEALAVGEGKKGFKELQNAANELQDKLDDLKDSSKSLQGSGIEKLKSSFGLLTESFKNADFGKAKIAFQGLGTAMKAVPIFLLVEGVMYLVQNFEKLSQGSGLLAKVFRGIGDVISWCIEKIYAFTDALGLTNSVLDKQGEAIEGNAEKLKKSLDTQVAGFDRQIAVAKAAGKNTVDLEIKKQEAIVETNRQIAQQIIAFQKAGGELTEKQKEIFAGAIENIKNAKSQENVVLETDHKEKLEKWKKANEEKKKAEAESWALTLKIRADNAEAQAKDDLRIAEENKAERIRINKEMFDQMTLEAEDAAKEDAKNSEARAEAMAAAYRTSYEGLKPYLINASKGLSDAFKGIGSELSNLAGNMVSTMTGAFEVISSKSATTTEKVMAGLNAVGSMIGQIGSYLKQEAELQAQEIEESYSRQSAALNTAKDAELAKEGLTAEQKIEIENRYKQQDYSLKVLAYNKETEIKKKAFEQDKKLKIAQTVIATITGVVGAVTGMISAIPGPVGIILGAVAGAAVAAMGAIQISQIKKQKFDAGSPPAPPTLAAPSANGGQDGGAGQAMDGPALRRIGRTTGEEDSSLPNGQRQSNEPMRAYVVSQDISSAQDKNSIIERRSSF